MSVVRLIKVLAFFISLLIEGYSAIAATVERAPFKIFNIYYQSWILSESEKGTNIEIIITKVKPAVRFDSVIFRGVRLEAFVKEEKNRIHIKSILPTGKSRIKFSLHVVNLPDQLIYHHNGIKKSLLLHSIPRRKTKYY